MLSLMLTTSALKVFYLTRLLILCNKESFLWSKNAMLNSQLTVKIVKVLNDTSDETGFQQSAVFVCFDDFPEELIRTFIQSHGGKKYPWFVTASKEETLRKQINLQVGQQVFFLNEEKKTLWESYVINEVRVQNKIGTFSMETSNSAVYKPMTMEGTLSRRSKDLKGLIIRAVTEGQQPYMLYSDKMTEQLEVKENYKPLPATKDLAIHLPKDEMTGMYKDYMEELALNMNFTYELYCRMDRGWGSFKNGSWDGMIRSLSALPVPDADLAMASLSMTAQRASGVDYLTPIGTETDSIYISSKVSERETWHWDLIQEPFSNKLWVALLIQACIVSLILQFWRLHAQERSGILRCIQNIPQDLWGIVTGYFGGTSFGEALFNKANALMLFSAIGGTLVFIFYRASLTSALSTRKTMLPFNSYSSLLNSEYRLVLPRRTGYLISQFSQANEGSTFKKLADKHFTKDKNPFFGGSMEVLKGVLATNEKLAGLVTIEGASTVDNFQKNLSCSLTLAWKSKHPRFNSMAFPKGSGLHPLFKYQAQNLISDGTLERVTRDWLMIREGCERNDDLSIGFEKSCSIFGIIGLAFAVSFALCLSEIIFYRLAGKSLISLDQIRKLNAQNENGMSQKLEKHGIESNQEGLQLLENMTKGLRLKLTFGH